MVTRQKKRVAEDLKGDTHGTDVIEPVWGLLEEAYELCGALPTPLERDFNIPPLSQLLPELERIRLLQGGGKRKAAAYA